MPLYEYRCTKCGHRFEKIQSFSAEPDTECPKCHGALMRPLTAPALQFKGAGWYVNDYAPKAASGTADSKPAESTTAPATEGKITATESAPKTASTESASSSSTGSASSSTSTPSSTPS